LTTCADLPPIDVLPAERAALNAELRTVMQPDDLVVLFGEDIGTLGGAFRVTASLQRCVAGRF
jgi:pyruvate/2-oxoglutarate/acetoin dehydrogenase E1 component